MTRMTPIGAPARRTALARSGRIGQLLVLAGLSSVLACTDAPLDPMLTPPDDGPRSVDQIVAGQVAMGQVVTVRGTIAAVTYGQDWDEVPTATIRPGRYILFAVSQELADRYGPWGLGARLPAERLRSRQWRLPQSGDVVEVRGRLTTVDFRSDQPNNPLLDELTAYSIVESHGPRLAELGETCRHDMDCADDLWCERSGVCAVVPELDWNSDLRNITGTCVSDKDCPIGQRCDPGYRVKDSGEYRPPYHVDRNSGRFLCQVDRAAAADSLCPRAVAVDELSGGRFPTGKELCLRARIAFTVFSPGDRDTHVQVQLAQPLRLPEAMPTLSTFQAATENAPPYKDPTNPLGPLVDPERDDQVEMLGTVHFDDGHGWWELHPIKWLRVLPHP